MFLFIQRINNEYSQGEDRFDRTCNLINTSEFTHDVKIILTGNATFAEVSIIYI